MTKYSNLILSTFAVVALGLVAAPNSFAGISTVLCLSIGDAPGEVATLIDEADTSGLGSKECKKVCKEGAKYCDTLVKNRKDCADDTNKTFAKFEQADCSRQFPADKDARKQCEKDAKDAEKANKNAIKDEEKAAKDDCKLIKTDCDTLCQ